jgi:site-specific recombinase XerD
MDLVPVNEAVAILLKEAEGAAREYMRRSKAPNTVRAYRADWRHFEAWCQERGLPSLPASEDTVALYLADLASWARTSTIQRRLSAIAEAHRVAGHEPPTRGAKVRLTWSGIRRTKGTAEEGKAPVLTPDLRRMVATCDDSLLGLRDRALLLLGFAGAFRRSELVSLDVADLSFVPEGLTVLLRRSKTDQEGAGEKIGIPWGARGETCPVRAVRAWLDASGIGEGPIFRPIDRHGNILPKRLSPQAVAIVVKRRAEAAGLDPRRYAGHSLRAGLATSAAVAGASERSIMKQTRHKSLPMVRRYIREADLFRENAAAQVGL